MLAKRMNLNLALSDFFIVSPLLVSNRKPKLVENVLKRICHSVNYVKILYVNF